MVYITDLTLASEAAEIRVIKNEKRTCFSTFYPFKIFPDKELSRLKFSDITILYGGNGSGKTTLLNIIGELTRATRHSEMNSTPFFSTYTELCSIDGRRPHKGSHFLSSDDVFDYVMNMRYLNQGIDRRREEIFDDYISKKKDIEMDSSNIRLHGLDDYDRFMEYRRVMKTSMSQYTREGSRENVDTFSNGETAMRYFTKEIDCDALYLIDEPENSLSAEYQRDLAKFIEDSARHFGCQFVISTHSPFFLAMKGGVVYDLDSRPVTTKKWTEVENVRRYFEFFEEHRKEFL